MMSAARDHSLTIPPATGAEAVILRRLLDGDTAFDGSHIELSAQARRCVHDRLFGHRIVNPDLIQSQLIVDGSITARKLAVPLIINEIGQPPRVVETARVQRCYYCLRERDEEHRPTCAGCGGTRFTS